MPQVTTNTQIDTINILNEAASAISTDYLLLQRGAVSYKLKKENLIIPRQQIASIDDLKVLGNVSGEIAAPSEITIDTDLSIVSGSHNTLASAKSIKDYIDNVSNNITTLKVAYGEGVDNALIDVSLGTITNGVYHGDTFTTIRGVIVAPSGNDSSGFGSTDMGATSFGAHLGQTAAYITYEEINGNQFQIRARMGRGSPTAAKRAQFLVIGE